MKNLHAYTAPGLIYPPYISINEVDGKHTITVRSPGNFGRTSATIELTEDQLRDMCLDVLDKLDLGLA